jgi:NhaA family Na+:H+ antiporter
MRDETAPRRGLRHHHVLRTTVPRLSQFALEHLLLLPLGAAIALVWVNVAPESYYSFSFGAAFLVNDVGMALFFAVMAKEVVEATAPGGVLHPWRRALLPVIAAIGATAVPALVHVRAVEALDEPMLEIGWPLSFGTDLAVGYFVARLIFRKHPVIPFLLLLGIAANAMGFVAVAFFPSAQDLHWTRGALLLAAGLAMAAVLRRRRVRSFWPYLLGAGGLSWYAFYRTGLHPALGLLPIMPFLPHAARDPGFFVDASPEARDTLSQFEVWWRHPAQLALFLFGLVNAGVPLRALEAGTWGLPLAMVAGRPIGLVLGVSLALAAGLHLPHRVGWRELVVAGFLAAIGFTMGLFFCTAIIAPGQLRSELSMGVLMTLAGAPLAAVTAWALRVGRFAPAGSSLNGR